MTTRTSAFAAAGASGGLLLLLGFTGLLVIVTRIVALLTDLRFAVPVDGNSAGTVIGIALSVAILMLAPWIYQEGIRRPWLAYHRLSELAGRPWAGSGLPHVLTACLFLLA